MPTIGAMTWRSTPAAAPMSAISASTTAPARRRRHLVRVSPDGRASVAAGDLMFPNGTVITEGDTLIIAETYGRRLTAFDIAGDGTLAGRRVFADLGDGFPDGICLDAEGAVWVATAPTRSRGSNPWRRRPPHLDWRPRRLCLHARRRRWPTLFICTNTGSGPAAATARAGRIDICQVDVPHAGRPKPQPRLSRRPPMRLQIKSPSSSAPANSRATLGNGKATALRFAQEGAKVLLVDRDRERAEATADAIAVEGGETAVLAADITREADCQAIAATCVERFGRIDILHNNVGRSQGDRDTAAMDADVWDELMAMNLKGMFMTYKHILPVMREQRSGGF